MGPPAWFFNLLAEFDALAYPQDAGGGEVPTPSIAAVLVPCCVQSASSQRTETQGRRGSVATLRVFFAPSTPQALASVRALKTNDRLKVQGYPYALVLDAPTVDESGRGFVLEAPARDVR